MDDTERKLNRTLQGIEKVIVYSTPDGEEFHNFEDFYNYMTDEYELSIKVSMEYDLGDALNYMNAEELFTGDEYDDIDEYMDEVDNNWTDYNFKLEKESGVDVEYVNFDDLGCNYIITGTINGLLKFCEGQCSHYTLDDAGECLYDEINELNKFKEQLAKLK